MPVDTDAVMAESTKAKDQVEKLYAAMCKAVERAKEKGKVFVEETGKLAVENEALASQNKDLEEEAVAIEAEISKLEVEEKDLVTKAQDLAKEIGELEKEHKVLKDEAVKLGDEEKKRKELVKKREQEVEAGRVQRANLSENVDRLLYHILMQILPCIKNGKQRGDIKALVLVLMKDGTLLEGLEKILKGDIPSDFRQRTDAAKSWKEGTDYFTPPLPQIAQDVAKQQQRSGWRGGGNNNGRNRSPPRNPPGKRSRQ